jgi:hypothetical protein
MAAPSRAGGARFGGKWIQDRSAAQRFLILKARPGGMV